MRINVVAFSGNGCRTALRLKESMPDDDMRLFCKTTHDNLGVERIEGRTIDWTGRSFKECDAIVFIGALGIAVRYIAPYIRSKDVDPAVVCMDEHGRWTIAVLSGHIGGGNLLAERISTAMGSECVITTATDINGRFSVDTFATRNGLRINGLGIAKDVSARVLDDRFVGFCSEIPVTGEISRGLTLAESGEFGVCISYDPSRRPFDRTMRLTPMDIVIGVGCRRDTDPDAMDRFVRSVLEDEGIAPERVSSVNSIDIKSDEKAILDLARGLKVPARFHSAETLNAIEGEFSGSGFVKSITDVDCVCERSALMSGGELILTKTAKDGMTLALARTPMIARFLI